MGICILAAVATVRLPKLYPGRWPAIALAVLTLWLAGSSLLAHPDYLPYFNELAGSEPEKIVVDSDLDWGQDIKRLAVRLKEVGADSVTFYPPVLADLRGLGFPRVLKEDPFRPSAGWNAVSMTDWKLTRMGLAGINKDGQLINQFGDRPLWPDRMPRGELVGKSILLWNVPPTSASQFASPESSP
jgi:hypothetical protein